MEALKPCPLCGESAILKDRWVNGTANRKNYWVECGHCKLKLQLRNSAKKAIAAWNRRVPDIVRCGECKYRNTPDCKMDGYDRYGIKNRTPLDDEYCSRGERRESEGKSDG